MSSEGTERGAVGELVDVFRPVGGAIATGVGWTVRGVAFAAFCCIPAALYWLMVNAVQWGVAEPFIGAPTGFPEGGGLGLLAAGLGALFVLSVVKSP